MCGTVKDHVSGFTHHQAPRLSSQATLSWEALEIPRGKLLDPAWGGACGCMCGCYGYWDK